MWIDSALCIGYGSLNEAVFSKREGIICHSSLERFKVGLGNGRGITGLALGVAHWASNRIGDISEKQASGKGSGSYPVKNDDITNCMPTYQD